MIETDMIERKEEFDPFLSLVLADTWWDLGRRLAPFIGDSGSQEQKTASLRDWVSEAKVDQDTDVIEALATDQLLRFVTTALALLERKYEGADIAADVRELVADARYDISDDGRMLTFIETPEAFWAWEYLYLFKEMHSTNEPDWTTAVGRCEGCTVFFVKTRIDQRFHNDACRKKAANLRFYRSGKAKAKRRRR